MPENNPELPKVPEVAVAPVQHNSLLASRLGGLIPSGIMEINVSELASQVDFESPIHHCPEGFSKKASYIMSVLHLLLISPRQFRTECGTRYSCDECPLKPLQE